METELDHSEEFLSFALDLEPAGTGIQAQNEEWIGEDAFARPVLERRRSFHRLPDSGIEGQTAHLRVGG